MGVVRARWLGDTNVLVRDALRDARATLIGGPVDSKEKYLRWLEEMWDVHKFDVHGRTEQEEERKEEVLQMFRKISELAQHPVEPPRFSPWKPSSDSRDERSAG
jgi:hypothetical protein